MDPELLSCLVEVLRDSDKDEPLLNFTMILHRTNCNTNVWRCESIHSYLSFVFLSAIMFFMLTFDNFIVLTVICDFPSSTSAVQL
jgi:hypothetical protein